MISLAYIVEASLSLLLFLGLYRICFAKLTFFTWNRFYLIGTLLFSVLIPFCDFTMVNQAATPSSAKISQWATKVAVIAQTPAYSAASSQWLTGVGLLSLIYWLVAGYYIGKVAIDSWSALRLVQRYPGLKYGNLHIIQVPDSIPTSSFFHYVFLNKTPLSGR